MKPLASTVRTLDWDELPASARELPDDLNPLDEGVLMKHQAAALAQAIKSTIFAVPKGRRTGITFAFGFEAVLTAGAQKAAGGMNVFYIGDTKEKGLEFIGYCAKFSRVVAQQQAGSVSGIEEFLFEDQDESGKTRQITAYRIRYASGFQITALSSRPANIRGLQGLVIIDEAAFHPDVQGVLDAATALLIWGGRIVVISSHNGKNNPFNQFVKDIENGLYGDDAAVMTVTFDDAVKNGLYERSCLVQGKTPTAADKKKWYNRIRNAYGPRKAAMREELDAIPRDGNGVCIPGVWIDRAMPEERPILRLVLDDDFAKKDENERKDWGYEWIERNLAPLMKPLSKESRHVFGQDFARHRHFSIIWPGEITQNLTRSVPFAIEMNNVPTRQQEQILWYVIEHLPQFSGGAMDATGPGQTIAEYTADRYGRPLIAEITLNRAFYGLWMPKFTQSFEDGTIILPRDVNIEADLRAIEDVNGIQMIMKPERKDLKDAELFRHGDSGGAGMMMWYASLNMTAPIEFASTGERGSAGLLRAFDNDYGQAGELTANTVRGLNDFKGYL